VPFTIEHIGIVVPDAVAMAAWYRDVLGFTIRLSNVNGANAGAFIAEADGKVMLELCQINGVTPLREKLDHALQFHLAFKSGDPDADAEFLQQNGAKLIEKSPKTPGENYFILLEDPWRNSLQLAKRAKSLQDELIEDPA
jgi:catechol 2,3-dioxygenase-like lactoylglutathione lyase family enzyme